LQIPAVTVKFLEEYFDKIFVITLRRATERQKQVKQRLKGLNFDFFYGVDKQTLTWEKVFAENIYDHEKAMKLNRHGKGMVLGHVACSLSHRTLYEHIISNKYDRVLIFEDDVVPIEDTVSLLPEAVSELPGDWEIVYFGYDKNETATPALKRKQSLYRILSYLRLLKWSQEMINNILPKPYSAHLRQAGFHDLLHAYSVTYDACRKLVPVQTPVVFNADPLVSYLIKTGKLKAFITEPKFFTQEQFLDSHHRSYIHHL
jgi:glycosyl transferase, family 25